MAPKCALVTGAGRRLGRAIALHLAAQGCGVVLHHRSSGKEARSVARDIRKRGGTAWTVSGDLARAGVAERLVARAARAAGRPVDLLVNNASTYATSTIAGMAWRDLQDAIRLEAWAPLVMTRAVAAQGMEAAVVNLLDTRIIDDDPGHAAYLLGKTMLARLTRLCALEFAPRVRVNGVAPGAVLPPAGKGAAALRKAVAATPLKRRVPEEDVAAAVWYLATASAVTGHVLFVDAGRHLGRGA